MLKIASKPLLQHQIEWLKKHRVKEIILCLGYHHDQIIDYFGNGSKFGVKISYKIEYQLLGTAGAIKSCESMLDDKPFVVLNGSVITDISVQKLIRFHNDSKADITMGLVLEKEAGSIVKTSGLGYVTGFSTPDEISSPFVNTGVCVMNPSILSDISDGTKTLEQVLRKYITKGTVFSVKFTQSYWINIKEPKDYIKVNYDIKSTRTWCDTPIKFSKDGWAGLIGKDFTVDNIMRIAFSIAEYCKNNNIEDVVIGYDNRLFGYDMSVDMADILCKEGIQAYLTESEVNTPTMLWASKKYGFGIMVSGSPKALNYNGIKINVDGQPTSEELYQEIEKWTNRVASVNHINPRHYFDIGIVNPTYSYQEYLKKMHD